MQSLRLTIFELRKQITSFSFIIITAIFVIFSVMQMEEIFHYPVKNDQDILALKERGGDVKDYLYVNSSPEEISTKSINYLNKIIKENQIEQSDQEVFISLIEKMEKENLTLDQAYNILSKENSDLCPWLDACKKQFGQKVGNADEINNNIKNVLIDEGYGSIFSEKYVTYIQLISAFLILPLFLIVFVRDSRCNINEIIYVQPISFAKYILCKYSACLISILVMLYVLGQSMNLYLIHKFKMIGWQANYNVFSSYYIIYIVPTILFLSSLIMFLVLLLKKAIAVFPLYIIYIVFNATQGVFLGHGSSNEIYKCIIRLMSENPSNNFIMLNRILYIVLSLVLSGCSCMLYKNSRKNSRRSIKL